MLVLSGHLHTEQSQLFSRAVLRPAPLSLALRHKKRGVKMKKITVGLSIHRPEMVPVASEIMRYHDAIFLEEPPTEGFQAMLDKTLSVDDYLMAMDIEYPEFSRRMCHLQQDLHAGGKAIYQVEPFLEELLGIHDLFIQGYGPGDIKPGTRQYSVYRAERNATGALLNYYKTVMNGSFEATIEAIRQFARADAARFRLRDRLRAGGSVDPLVYFPSDPVTGKKRSLACSQIHRLFQDHKKSRHV